MKHRPKCILLQRFTKLPDTSSYLRRESGFPFVLLVFPCSRIYVRTSKGQCLKYPMKLMGSVVVQEQGKTRCDGAYRIAISLGKTEELSFEVLLHGVIVTDKDVAPKGFVSREALCRGERLEPLVRSSACILGPGIQVPAVVAVVVVAVAVVVVVVVVVVTMPTTALSIRIHVQVPIRVVDHFDRGIPRRFPVDVHTGSRLIGAIHHHHHRGSSVRVDCLTNCSIPTLVVAVVAVVAVVVVVVVVVVVFRPTRPIELCRIIVAVGGGIATAGFGGRGRVKVRVGVRSVQICMDVVGSIPMRFGGSQAINKGKLGGSKAPFLVLGSPGLVAEVVTELPERKGVRHQISLLSSEFETYNGSEF
jgi:hypothetical protein